MRKKSVLAILLFSGIVINGQTTRNQEQNTPSPSEQRRVDMQRQVNREREFDRLRQVGGNINRRSQMPGLRRSVEPTRRDKELTSLTKEDKTKFASFLDLPKTGFVRFHDAAACDEESVIINANEQCPWNIAGKGTAYSFREESYNTAFYSDIKFKDSNFQIAGANVLGFLTNIGDVALEKVTLQTDGVREMTEFEMPAEATDVKKKSNLAEKGFKVGNFVYRTAQPVQENTTYALRCVAYRSKLYRKVESFKINLLENDKRVDITIVFRVIRKHDDGSVSILWKELSRRAAPKLIAKN